MNNSDYIGAEWVRVDIHLHSPGVGTFNLSPGVNLNSKEDKRQIVEEYIEKLIQANIKVAAITDYNGIRKEWFIPIRNEAQKQGVFILPGVELSISLAGGKYGLHLIAIFEDTINIDGFNTFLHSLDKNPQNPLVTDRTHRNIDSRFELEELVKEIRKNYNCLIIFAHPEEDKGLFKSFSPKEAAKYISTIKPDTFEYFSDNCKNKLISTNEIDKDSLDNIAIIENSDPKSIDDIGTKKRNGKIRTTYIKLSDFTLDALKLALHDPEVRVKLYETPKMLHSRITKITINGTTFLKDINLSLNPELNTLIGGRGVGKSAIIESVRYCLDLPIYSENSQKNDFVSAVVGSGGEVSVEIDKYYGQKKTSYKVKRIIGKEPEVYDEKNEELHLSPTEIFEKEKNPIIIGQKELYVISQDEKFLLQLSDQFIGDKIKTKQKEFEDLKIKLDENGKKILESERKLAKRDEYDQQLKSIESKIKDYEKLGVVKKLEKYTQILEDDERIISAEKKLQELIQNIEDILNQSKQGISEIISSLKRGKSEKKNILEKLAMEFEGIKNLIEQVQFVAELNNIYETKVKKIIKNWNAEKEKSEKEIEDVKRKLGEEKLQPEKLEEHTRQKARIESLLKEFNRYVEQLDSAKKERKQLKEKIKDVRHELFKIRENEIRGINQKLKESIKMSVIYEGEKKVIKKYISNLLQGSGLHKDAIDSLIEAEGLAIDGILISDFIASGKGKIMEKFNLTDKMAERLIEYFKDKNKLFELETLFPDDLIKIELNIDEKFIALDKLSPGQKATALLLLMFAMEDRILILDQPEEDLDNRFIYEDIVRILRDIKGGRQIITATHNANIPVIGDSELIVVLDKQEEQCKLVDRGSVDKQSIKEQVKRIMEGGEEAFIRRAEKYGGII
ncbi:MAG: TrlF family AAA-like ATPase [Candidatus Hodarchaeales archaeon]